MTQDSKEECDHEWKLITDSAGDEIYIEHWEYWECLKCGATKDVGLHDDHDTFI